MPLFALVACGSPEEVASPERVENAWVRLPAVEGRPAAAYFRLNGGEDGATLIALESDRATSVEIHETLMQDGAMRMRPIDSVPVEAGGTVSFEPGGRHGMIFGLDPEITPGTDLSITFRFDGGEDVQVQAITIPAGGDVPFEESDDE